MLAIWWLEVFKHFISQHIEYDTILRVQFVLVLPGANVSIECVFSLINGMWSDAKTQLTTETLKSMLITIVNISVPCCKLIKFSN